MESTVAQDLNFFRALIRFFPTLKILEKNFIRNNKDFVNHFHLFDVAYYPVKNGEAVNIQQWFRLFKTQLSQARTETCAGNDALHAQ